ncbi:MAG: GIY-YIG nuclease family protein [Patescibacteria group bacterium]
MVWFTYFLLCDKKTYYIGLTHNLTQRIFSHKSKQNIATKEFSYLELVYSEQYATRREAEKREQQLKRWAHAKKKALVEGNLKLLKRLSKTRSLSKDNLG